MAHAGKFYPLAFRRDFCLNLNNYNSGAAKSYHLTWTQTQGTVGNAVRGFYPMLTGGEVDNVPEQSWFTPVVHTPGGDVFLRLYGTLEGSPYDVVTHVEIIQVGGAILYRSGLFDHFGSVGRGGGQTSLHPPLIQTPITCFWNGSSDTTYEANGW